MWQLKVLSPQYPHCNDSIWNEVASEVPTLNIQKKIELSIDQSKVNSEAGDWLVLYQIPNISRSVFAFLCYCYCFCKGTCYKTRLDLTPETDMVKEANSLSIHMIQCAHTVLQE